MLGGIRTLQLGTKNWSEVYKIPSCLEFSFAQIFEKEPKSLYDLVFVDRELSENEIKLLCKVTKAYTVFFIEDVTMTKEMEWFSSCKMGQKIARCDIQKFLSNEARNYFSKSYGEKFVFKNLAIVKEFSGSIVWNGNYSVKLEGDFGEEFHQVAFWRNNIPVFKGQAIDFWLECNKDSEVEIALSITQFRNGSLSTVQQEWFFKREDTEKVMTIDNQMETGPIFVSLLAKGKGKLEIIALHDRYSRRGHGEFLPGGKRYVSSKREEIFYYFDPGDLKPPLNVYMSGYKTMQGFEGYYMMRKLGSPFLLIAEPRLEGGSFYMGDEEYENSMVSIIQAHMKALGFSNEEVILSGMSMGSFGALYYGCDILPHTIIVGKPLANIGDVAQNERLHRPGGFPTSLDVLNYICKDTDKEAIEKLNARFWKKFDNADWKKSRFVVAYMKEDDYDSKAYQMLITHLKTGGVEVYGKGIHGRHNDATGEIAAWFRGQYEIILEEYFSRSI